LWLPVYPNPGGADHAFLVDAEGEAVAVAVFRLADEDRDVIGFTGPSVDWQWCSKIPRLQGKSVFGPEGLSRPRIFTGFSSGWIKVRRSTSSEVENLPEKLSKVWEYALLGTYFLFLVLSSYSSKFYEKSDSFLLVSGIV